MATQYGRLQEFEPESDSIKAYLERVSLYFAANDIADCKKVPVLLSSIGALIYALLNDPSKLSQQHCKIISSQNAL